ncbi:uncharacterized protein [Euwallacea similis]|uniref:uncharacterized protein n=1 Tax=Euwallacea similis TaxID=1736056 RepID=UPI00344FBE2B
MSSIHLNVQIYQNFDTLEDTVENSCDCFELIGTCTLGLFNVSCKDSNVLVFKTRTAAKGCEIWKLFAGGSIADGDRKRKNIIVIKETIYIQNESKEYYNIRRERTKFLKILGFLAQAGNTVRHRAQRGPGQSDGRDAKLRGGDWPPGNLARSRPVWPTPLWGSSTSFFGFGRTTTSTYRSHPLRERGNAGIIHGASMNKAFVPGALRKDGGDMRRCR